jgi:hypothetical protein
MIDRVEMFVDGQYVRKHPYWIMGKAKNYIARIVGPDPKYKWKREWLNIEKSNGTEVFKKSDFRVGEVYDITSKRKMADGPDEVAISGFYRCDSISQNVTFIRINEDEIISKFTDGVDGKHAAAVAEELIAICGRNKDIAKRYIDAVQVDTKDLQSHL